MEKNKYPRFVKFKGTVLRRRTTTNDEFIDYWCDNGVWGIGAYLELNPFGPKANVVSKRDDIFKSNIRLIEATEEEWVKAVGRYRPSNVKLLDGHVSFGQYIPNKEANECGNPCAEISLGESESCVLFADIEVKNKYRYLLIAC